jgi:vancomycin resistance protein YoaR
VDAEIDLAKHAKVPDQPGEELDLAATVESIARDFSAARELDLVTRSVSADVKVADLDDIDVSKVLASFETRYHVFKHGRSHNVELGAKKLNGAIMRPLQRLSFNKRIGPRSVDAGFQQAPEILGDELSVGIGGGICQVASTLHGAAVHGGIAVLDRKSHSRLSNYIALGLDATVAYPEVDLELQNPFNFTVIVHAFIPEPGIVRVELLGGDEVDSVEYTYGVSRIEDYVRRISVKNFLKPGTSVRKQKGTRGMDVFSYVTIRFKNGRVDERRYYSGYRPTPEVFWIAPEYDEGELPPLPKHAKGVEGRLQQDGSDVYEG